MKASEASFTARALIGQLTNQTITSLGVFGSASVLAAIAAFFNFVYGPRRYPRCYPARDAGLGRGRLKLQDCGHSVGGYGFRGNHVNACPPRDPTLD